MTGRVFIDGHVGTTGLRIQKLLAHHEAVELLTLPEARRKDESARRDALNQADVCVLCLPDAAALQAASWLENADTRLLDASTAHRVDPDWVYGLPELGAEQRTEIRAARRVSNPGCYPQGVILALRPLIGAGIVPSSFPLIVHSLSGYSGGGRELIERWEAQEPGLLSLKHAAPYALDRLHKHIPEMTLYSGLEHEPHFVPSVGPFYCGMRTELSLPVQALRSGATGKTIWEVLDASYRDEAFVQVERFSEPLASDELSFDPQAFNETNQFSIAVVSNPLGHVALIIRYDNLGKGAAGSAVQNLNLMLGLDEGTGLR